MVGLSVFCINMPTAIRIHCTERYFTPYQLSTDHFGLVKDMFRDPIKADLRNSKNAHKLGRETGRTGPSTTYVSCSELLLTSVARK